MYNEDFKAGNPLFGEPIGSRRPMVRSEVAMIASHLGLGAVVLDLHNVDYTRGSMRKAIDTRCFWLKDGRQVSITMTGDGSVIGSVTKEPDPDLPEPLQGYPYE